MVLPIYKSMFYFLVSQFHIILWEFHTRIRANTNKTCHTYISVMPPMGLASTKDVAKSVSISTPFVTFNVTGIWISHVFVPSISLTIILNEYWPSRASAGIVVLK